MLVVRRTDVDVPMEAGRDLWLDEEMKKAALDGTGGADGRGGPALHPLHLGQHRQAEGADAHDRRLPRVRGVHAPLVFDYHPGEIYFCAADVGWVTGHSYIVYGPLANGATTVMFESTPVYPDPGRYWQIVDDLGVNIFYTAPTALRALAQHGNDWVKKYKRSSLRFLGSVGEPINPEIWRWYHDVVGDSRCAVSTPGGRRRPAAS